MLPLETPNLFIDGRRQEPSSKERFDVISPATGEKLGYVPAGNETDIDRAVEVARKVGREHAPYAIDEYLLDKTISIEPSEALPEEVVLAVQALQAHA